MTTISINDLIGENLTKIENDIKGSKLIIHDCENSNISIMDVSSSVILEDLIGCKIFLGPAIDSVRLTACFDCIITLACKTLVVTECKDCVLFIHIEDDSESSLVSLKSRDISVAQYNGNYVERNAHFALAGLNLKNNLWQSLRSSSDSQIAFITPGPLEKDGELTAYALLMLRWIFSEADKDLDMTLNCDEANDFFALVQMDLKFASSSVMADFFQTNGIDTTPEGNLPLKGFYSLFGRIPKDRNSVLMTCLKNLGIGLLPEHCPISDSKYVMKSAKAINFASTNRSLSKTRKETIKPIRESEQNKLKTSGIRHFFNETTESDALNFSVEDRSIGISNELTFLEELLSTTIRQGDIYKRIVHDLVLNTHEPSLLDQVIDIPTMQKAWRSKDLRYNIELKSQEVEMILEEIGEGDLNFATRQRVADYLYHLRYKKYLSFKDWKSVKSEYAQTSEKNRIRELQKALLGEPYNLEDHEVKDLLTIYDIIPDSLRKRESEIFAKEWMSSSAGKEAIKIKCKSLARNANDGSILSSTTKKLTFTISEEILKKARKLVLKERIEIELKNTEHGYRRFQEYRRDIKITMCSFPKWIENVHAMKNSEKAVLKKWKKAKKREEEIKEKYDHAFCLLSDVEEKINMIMSFKSKQGMHIELRVKKLRESAKNPSHPSVVSCSTVREIFGDLLYSLHSVKSPAAIELARKLYDPFSVANKQLEQYIQENESEFHVENGNKIQEKEIKEKKETLLNQLQLKTLMEAYPLLGDGEAAKAGKNKSVSIRKEGKKAHKDWLLKKLNEAKEISQVVLHETQAKEAADKIEKKEKKKKKREALRKWMKAVKSREPLQKVEHPEEWLGVGLDDNAWMSAYEPEKSTKRNKENTEKTEGEEKKKSMKKVSVNSNKIPSKKKIV